MNFIQIYARWFKKILPSPFSIAVILTVFVFTLTILISQKSIGLLMLDWQAGLWESSLLTFAFQMMLMLVLGHALALSRFFESAAAKLVMPISTTAQAAALVTFTTILVAFVNWGLALIFGAILARKVGEHFSRKNLPLNYPLIGAAGYVGLMVWHGGLSGSALAKVAESGHLQALSQNDSLPIAISYNDTVFSAMNMVVWALLLVCIPLVFYWLGKNNSGRFTPLDAAPSPPTTIILAHGAERIDESRLVSKIVGAILVGIALYVGVSYTGHSLGFITPNFINFGMLALCILLHKNFATFLAAVDSAVKGASSILIQFPLYFGLLALMQSGGLLAVISHLFMAISNEHTVPLFTFFSAGLVNIFVPSGGGQWAIQGPIVLQAATQHGIDLPKMVLALAYGDQLTNMLQPFWALPLLGITGLKAKDILPYTLVLFFIGLVIFAGVLCCG